MLNNPLFERLESMEISLFLQSDDFLRKLAHVWWLHSAQVNRRLAGTKLVALTDELLSKFNPSNLLSQDWQMVSENPEVLHLIPKCHLHDSFSMNCYEIGAEFTRNLNESLILFVPVQLEGDEAMDLPHPQVEREYAFYLKPKCANNDGQQWQRNRSNLFELHLLCNKDLPTHQKRHLRLGLWPSLQRWSAQILEAESQRNADPTIWLESNVLLEPNSYMKTYLRLKDTHGEQIIQNWPTFSEQESVRIRRLVLNQCANAAYLMEFWRLNGLSPKRFAVYPCGRGILVHLLALEGFSGFGLNCAEDESKCWQQFQGTDLRVTNSRHFSAEVHSQLEGVDFLIGQQEAVPWIPLLAARLRCNFFLILSRHCYDFFMKFQKNAPGWLETAGETSNSRVELYLKYLRGICTELGFQFQTDQLRISSKNRKCIIGTIPPDGLFPPADEMLEMSPDELLEVKIAEILDNATGFRTDMKPKQVKRSVEMTKFSAKDEKEQLSKKIIYFLIGLEPTAMIGNWRCGKAAVPLKQLADELLDENDRKTFSNCGKGIVAFLRTQRQLFDTQKGIVSIRCWPEDFGQFSKKDGGKRQSECLFKKLHPDGCPLDDKQCPYRHTGTD